MNLKARGHPMYKIGQVLYVISSGTRTIEPVQVHSKKILESWDGTTVQHMCATTDNKTISLEKHNEKGLLAGIFETVEEAKAHLFSLASEMVDKLADKASEKAGVFEPVREESSRSVSGADSTSSVEALKESVQTVTLDDGTIARVHLPPEV